MAWRCDRCGETHNRNPNKCKNCGYTVLSPIETDEISYKRHIMVFLIIVFVLVVLFVYFVLQG